MEEWDPFALRILSSEGQLAAREVVLTFSGEHLRICSDL